MNDDMPVPKPYIYFAVFFSLVVEMVNMRLRKRINPVRLHQRRTFCQIAQFELRAQVSKAFFF